jgi:hypothetical protein
MQKFTINGHAARAGRVGTGGEDEGINLKGGTNVLISQVEIKDCGQDGMDFDGGEKIIVRDCIITDCLGNGVHNVGGGPPWVIFSGCRFERNGYERNIGDGVGAGIDSIGSKLIASNCIFIDNCREINMLGGKMMITDSYMSHDTVSARNGGLYEAAVEANPGTASELVLDNVDIYSFVSHGVRLKPRTVKLSSCSITTTTTVTVPSTDEIIVGMTATGTGVAGGATISSINTGTKAVTMTGVSTVTPSTVITFAGTVGYASLTMRNCRVQTAPNTGAPTAVNRFGLMVDNFAAARITSSVFAGDGGGIYISGGANAFVSGNEFASTNNYGLQVEGAVIGNVIVSNNKFKGGGLRLGTGAGAWNILGNDFASGMALRLFQGGGDNSVIKDNVGNFPLTLDGSGASTGLEIIGNSVGTLTIGSGNTSSGSTIMMNTITAITHTGGNFSLNTWRRNTGAGCAEIFYGTATLASGTATITSAAANSARKWSLTRQAKNSSTRIGSPSIGTVTAQTSFVIDSLESDATVETGDLSSVYWEILE